MNNNLEINIYYHIAEMNSWEFSNEIIQEHIKKSNLINIVDNFYYCINGNFKNVSLVIQKNLTPQCQIVHLRNDYKHYEFPTLNFLHSECHNKKQYVLYIHTKGASRPVNYRDGHNNHLDRMCLNTIGNYEECINAICEEYDAAGLAFTSKPFPHYSGNIWWSKSDHIIKLKKLEYGIKNFNFCNDYPDRHDAEKWLCSAAGNFYTLNYSDPFSKYYNLTYD